MSGSDPSVPLDAAAVRRLTEVVGRGAAEPLPAPDGYEILGIVGAGGMGMVYRAVEQRLHRTVALKVGRDTSRGLLQRFEQEARITAELEHPSIPPVFELGRLVDGRPFYTMRLVTGRDLRGAVRDAHARGNFALRLPSLLRVVADVCDVVEYAHSRSIVHRDLKPENVLLGDYGEVWVIDWGLGEVLADPRAAEEPVEEDGRMLGTPAYMAPEQARGEASGASVAADVYALGCMVLEVLTGASPFAGESTPRILERLRSGETPAPPRSSRTPKVLARIATKALSARAGERYGSAHALADDLRRYLDGLSVAAYPERSMERLWRGIVRHRIAVGVVATYILVRTGILLAFGR